MVTDLDPFELQALDPDFLTSVLSSLPGVQTSNPAVQEAMNALSDPKDDNESKEESSDKKDA